MKEQEEAEPEWTYAPAGDEKVPFHSRASSELREVSLPAAIGHWISRRSIELWLKCCYRLQIEGAEHLPDDTPFILIGNHTSHLDALVLGSICPNHLLGRVFSLAAGDLFFETHARAMVSAQVVNALPIWRRKPGAQALKMLKDRLHRGDCGFILFPEGTRSRDGAINTFKPGIGMLIAGTKVPVIPCYLEGCREAWPASHRFPRPGKLRVRILPPLSFPESPDTKEGWAGIARQLEDIFRTRSSD